MLPRSQQLITLFLGLCLTGLWIWQATGPLTGGTQPAVSFRPHFIQIEGDVPRPGIHVFDHAPSLAEVCQTAGAQSTVPLGFKDVSSGTKVLLDPDLRPQLTVMAGSDLITLGLALDLNRASATDLEAVPGLGPVLAGRIVEFRQQQGPFRRLDDLLQIKGIGPKLLEKIRPYVVIIDEAASAAAERSREAGTDGQN